MRARFPVLALLVACCLVGCGGSASGSVTTRSHTKSGSSKKTKKRTSPKRARGTGGLKTVGITSGGHRRTYLLYVPPGDTSKHRLPLVLLYHGADDTASHAAGETDLLNVAEQRHDMIVVFPQGYDNTWNEGAGNTPAHQAGINDVAFTRAILTRIESHYYVDLRRVVATGLSNGALLTELLGCRLASNLTLIVPVEGQLPVSVSAGCRPRTPVSVYEVHGTADQAIPYRGGRFYGVGGGTTVLSAPASAARWAQLDGCSGSAQQAQSGSIGLTQYGSCNQSVSVTLASIQGGTHTWPSSFGEDLLGVIGSLNGGHRAVKP